MNKLQKLEKQISNSQKLESEIKNESLNHLENYIKDQSSQNPINVDLKELKNIKDQLHKMDQDVSNLYDTLNTSIQELDQQNKRYFKFYKPNIEIDLKEKNHITQGKSFYKLFWIFLFGSFLGYLVETLFALLKTGTYSNHSGLLFGPFNIIYGIGATLLTIFLFPYRSQSKKKSFLIAILIGTIVEYLSSFIQEFLFSSTSWDYSHLPFNLDGRVCLLYSIFWGILGIYWIKVFYPILANVLLKINERFLKVLTIILLIFMIFNISFSAIATINWKMRLDGLKTIPYFDHYYPNEVMEDYYPNLVFKK